MHDMILGATMMAGLCLYFLPTVIATACGVRRLASIFAVNLTLGWTVVAWIATLLWVLAEWDSGRGEPIQSRLAEGDSWSFDPAKSNDSVEPGDRWVLGH